MQPLLRKYISQVIVESTQPSKEQIDSTLDLLQKIVKSSSEFKSHVFLVGGAVRDHVMGKESKDLDIVIDLPKGGIRFAEYLAKRLGIYKQGSNPVVYPKFGTAKVDLHGVTHNDVDLTGIDIEAVVTRTEVYEPGNRKPEVAFGTINQDVMRRDLTINSLVKDLTTGNVLDLTGKGFDDIKKGVIRTPGSSATILEEDPLRILRAIRFTSRYKYKLDKELQQAIKEKASKLKNISRERVRDEFEKMITNENAQYAIQLLTDNDLMEFIIPEYSPDSDINNLLNKQDGNLSFTEMLIIMLHNLDTETINTSLRALKVKNDVIKYVTLLTRAIQTLKVNSAKNMILKVGAFLAKQNGLKYINILHIILPELRNQISNLKEFGKQPVIYFDGDHLINMFGLKPGPEIGKLISLQRELWFNNPGITKEKVGKYIRAQNADNDIR